MADESDATREQKMAEIKARAEALRAARAAAKGAATPVAPAPPAAAGTSGVSVAPDAPPAAAPAESATAPAAPPSGGPGGEAGAEMSREEKMAAIRARAEALKAARASGAAPSAAPKAQAAVQTVAATPAAPTTIEVPVSSINPGGRPGTPPQAPALEAFGTLNQSVELRAAASEHDNIKKLLGGLGAYQNPLRGDAWQIDYRYYAEARRRLEAAGYTVSEKDYLDRPIANWSPTSRGWTRVES
ncbi:MAG: hypothetical protein QN178_07270 [Armatimonadota bacterium]|nr:hypothetical protein [Armatimonadota bacterium]